MSSGRRRVLVGLALCLATGAVVVTIALHTGMRPVEARRVDQSPATPPALSATHTTSVVGVGVPEQPRPAPPPVPTSARERVPAEPVTTPVTATTGTPPVESVPPPPAPQDPPATSSSPGTSSPQDPQAPGSPFPPWFHPLLGLPWVDACSLLRLEQGADHHGQHDNGRHDNDHRLLRICLG
jgi:hypothetical protein